jgi:multiple sugar transport system substrate-binding protein
MFKKTMLWTTSLLLAAAAAGCGKESAAPDQGAGGSAQPKPAVQEPVTLQFYLNTVLSDEDFEMYINQFVKKKFPHVTLQLVKKGSGTALTDLITAGQIPDIVWEGLTNIRGSLELDMPMNLNPLIEKKKFDLTKFDAKITDSIKSYSPTNDIRYLPFNVFVFATQYNKDIFDKFGVPYLKDGMTWEAMVEVGNKMKRQEQGVQYLGIQTSGSNRTQTQLSLALVDEKSEKAAVQTEGWKKLFELWKSYGNVPGQPVMSKFSGRDEFHKTKNLAIFPDILMLQNTDMVTAEKEGLNWDVVTFPTFKDRPNIGVGVFSDGFYIPNGSKHADLAFDIISYLSADREVQLAASQNGRITGLNDSEIKKQAFSNNPAAKGKNLQNIYSLQFPDPYRSTTYDRSATSVINKKILQYIEGTTDLNTILRQAEEEINKAIEAAKKQ